MSFSRVLSVARSRVLGIITSVVVGAPVLVAVTPMTANAATCYGNWCSGQDPHATGCDVGAISFASARIPSTWTYIELRWSPSCKTEWARVLSGYGESYRWGLQVTQPRTGYTQSGVVGSNGTYSWTRQIYSPQLCVYASWVAPPGPVGTACV
jgi:hypothetical protein